MMRILVTGASGFLGRQLMAQLARETGDFTIDDSGDTDLVSPYETYALMVSKRPTLIFHLAAAVGGIGANQKKPGTFFRDNMLMGINVLEAARQIRRPLEEPCKIVMVGTCCSYPAVCSLPMREEQLWDGYPEPTNAPYGVAKRALITMAQAYRKEFGSNIVTAIPANLYGPGDNFDLETSHVIPAMIRKFIEARDAGSPSVELWGDGSPTREFLYVNDCARMLIKLAKFYNKPEPVNLGTGFMYRITDLADQVRSLTRYSGRISWNYEKPNGQQSRVLDLTRAHQLGLSALVSLQEGLELTISWYQSNRGSS
jgi:GDP-L-fucose synthase